MMIRIFLIWILLNILISPSPILATADGPDYWKVINVESDDVLNIREKSTWKSNKVGEIPFNGKCIQNLGCIGGLTLTEFTDLSEAEKQKIRKKRLRWCKIRYKNIIGWVAGRYLSEGQDDECYIK